KLQRHIEAMRPEAQAEYAMQEGLVRFSDAQAALQSKDEQIERLKKLDAEYGRVETAIIMADPAFDGDSDHADCGDRLIASVQRMKEQIERLTRERDEWRDHVHKQNANVAHNLARAESLDRQVQKLT